MNKTDRLIALLDKAIDICNELHYILDANTAFLENRASNAITQ